MLALWLARGTPVRGAAALGDSTGSGSLEKRVLVIACVQVRVTCFHSTCTHTYIDWVAIMHVCMHVLCTFLCVRTRMYVRARMCIHACMYTHTCVYVFSRFRFYMHPTIILVNLHGFLMSIHQHPLPQRLVEHSRCFRKCPSPATYLRIHTHGRMDNPHGTSHFILVNPIKTIQPHVQQGSEF